MSREPRAQPLGQAVFTVEDGGRVEIVVNGNGGAPIVCFDVHDLFGNRAVFSTSEAGVEQLVALVRAAIAEVSP